jgi:hypothetical protein
MFNGAVEYSKMFTEGAGQRAVPGFGVLDINGSAKEVNGLGVQTINPNTGLPVAGPFQADIALNSSMSFEIAGAAGQPIVLLAGPLNTNLINYGMVGQFDIGTGLSGILPTGLIAVAIGTNPGLMNSFFVTNAAGDMEISFFVSGSFPLGVFTTYQAILYTGNSQVIQFTNAVTLNIVP